MAPDTAPAWTVTQQAETTDLGPDGNYQPGIRVTFRLANGTVGSVFVPHAGYSVENVRRLIADKAESLAAVADLRG